MPAYITKSDFVAARDCHTKLYYRKNDYPSATDNDFMEQLAVGGQKVGKLAQLEYPDGILVSTLNTEQAVEETQALLEREQVVLFEPAFVYESFLVRVDILVKEGNRLQLIEVKSSSASDLSDILKDDGLPRAGKWEKHVSDVTYQRMVVSRCLPDAEVECFLMVLDKNKRSQQDDLPDWLVDDPETGRVVVRDGGVEVLAGEDLLTAFPVGQAVTAMLPEIEAEAGEMAAYVGAELSKADPEIGYKCRKCEFRIKHGGDDAPNGFRECWGDLADEEPHLLDLFQLGRVKNPDGSLVADTLPQEGRASLLDVDTNLLTTGYAPRQLLQIEGSEWVSDELEAAMAAVVYPLRFIDFEASSPVIPYTAGRRPYETCAFQWSCHTVEAGGGVPEHTEYLRTERGFPNYEFAQSLRVQLGDAGTVLIWSGFEKSVLRQISSQIQDDPDGPADLAEWIGEFVENSGRILDMEKLCKDHYFHPDMGGQTSIKAVLPAVWNNTPALRERPYFAPYASEEDGRVLSPYDTLPEVEIGGETVSVAEGGMAIKAFDRMLYGSDSEEEQEQWADLLREYCKLDTMAMVMILEYWLGRVADGT